MKKSLVFVTGLFVAGVAVATTIALFGNDCSAPLDEAVRVTNATSPKMVADAIRLEGAQLFAKKITFTYTLLSAPSSEIDQEVWARLIKPQVDRDIERAAEQEAKGLVAESTTVIYRYLDLKGRLMAEVVSTQICEQG